MTRKELMPVLDDVDENQKNVALERILRAWKRYQPSENSVLGKEAFRILKWICRNWPHKADISDVLIELVATLLIHTQTRRLWHWSRRKICVFYDSLTDETQSKFINKLFALDVGLLAFSVLIDHLHATGQLEKLQHANRLPKKEDVVDRFINTSVLPKQKQAQNVRNQDSARVLQHFVTEEIFGSMLMPAIHKALLRSSETTLEVVECVLQCVALDLNNFAVDLANLLITSLRSQSDETILKAIRATGTVASKVTSPAKMLEFVDCYFGVLFGAEGKLATSGSKISILKAIKSTAKCGITGTDLHNISAHVLKKCIKLLETEVHDGTSQECLNVMTSWSSNLGPELPREVREYISKTFSVIKGSLRFHFFSFIVSIFNFERIKHVDFILPQVFKCLDKPVLTSQNPVSEGLALLVLVIRNSRELKVELSSDNLTTVKTTLADFISKNTMNCLLSCLYVLEITRFMVPRNSAEVSDVLFDATVHVMTQANYEVRRDLKESFEDFLSSLSTHQVINGLVPSFARCVKSHKTSGHVVEETIRCILHTYRKSLSKAELNELLVELIWLTHTCHQKQYWITIVRQLGLSPPQLIESNWTTLNQKYVENFDNDVTTAELLRTLALVAGAVISEDITTRYFKVFNHESTLNVTQEDYMIFKSKSSKSSEIASNGNKTGSKEHTDRDKRKPEIDDRRKKHGKEKEVLTAKQKEVLKLQEEKEAEVFKRLSELDMELKNVTQLFEIIVNENVYAFGPYMPEIITSLLNAMKSPLANPYAINIFKTLGNALMTETTTGTLVTQLIITMNSSSQQDAQVEPSVKIALKLLKGDIESDALDCLIFSYCFPLFLSIQTKFEKKSAILLEVFECISMFLKKLCMAEYYTDPVPRDKICKLLYTGLDSSDNLVQQKCLTGLLELAKSSNSSLAQKSRESEIEQHIQALFEDVSTLRDAGIRSLAIILQNSDPNTKDPVSLKVNICRTRFDEDVEIKELAEKIWRLFNYTEDLDLAKELLQHLTNTNECVRCTSAKAICHILEEIGDQEQVEYILEKLILLYTEHLEEIPAVMDNLGRILEPAIDKWEGRHGVGYTLKLLAPAFPLTSVSSTLEWLIRTGLVDRNMNARNICLDAAVEIVNIHGKEFLTEFVTLIESFLDGQKQITNEDSFQEACVILMGCHASHMDQTDSRVSKIFSTLVDTLSTPSEKVQEAVANCLPALVPALGTEATVVMNTLLQKVMESNTYGGRRGAAYGLAGLVKGMGILSLKQHNIMNVLAEGMQDKKDYRRKEGCLMALELLCKFLGRLFEPYIVHVLPHLLQCLGDTNVYVREATENTAKCLMSRLSGHGVKLVLPALLNALNEDSWRTKCGSVDLLGRMAYCAPKQLSGCLPMIVPHLIEVLSDSHVKVQEAATKALGLIGSVIRNPEIQSVVPILLQALEDPSKKTHKCMQVLLKTEFVHFVDPPSLALIMPVVQRAFQDRSTETRRMASQIIGNMYSLTDHSDLIPYMNSVMPGLKTSLTDPVPEVRSVAAKALGSMSKGLGEKCYDEILPWLLKTLVSETSSVDRSGAAQGLAEVIGALGEDKLQRFMPEIIRKAESDEIPPHVRDGYMMMFIYMPSVFGEDFIPYIGQILTPILKALADENEFVRETALKAGQRIVAGYAETAITLLLPELEKGIFDENWRIRFSSVQLLGDLLYKISGVSGKMSTESSSDDDNFGTELSQNVIIQTLGLERRDRVLAGLYIERSDVALMVRQAALHVWKVVVANTPKTLREILKTLFSLLLGLLASPSHDKRQVAARTLGDLVRKLGEKILPEILPLLEQGLESSVAAERQGVCVGLAEIMTSTSREMVLVFLDNLVPTLRKGLCDSNPDVRSTAAQTFGSLHSAIGSRALDEVIPYMLKKIDDSEEGENALYGLGQLVLVRSKSVMPYVIPHLLSPPVNLKALAVLSAVSGEAMSKHLSKILPTLVNLLKTTIAANEPEKELKSCGQVLLSITDEDGVRTLINDLLGYCNMDSSDKVPGVLLLSIFCSQTKSDLTPYLPELIKNFILHMVLEDTTLLKYIVEALAIVIKSIDANEQPSYVGVLHQSLRFAKVDLKNTQYLPGLCVPKGINSVLPVFREALLNGPAEIKEAAALGMNELIALTSPEALKPTIILITGPLIRILGDRYGPNIKIAVIQTLTLLLERVGLHLKAFLPQLQTTFLKGSVDPNRNVRLTAASALVELVKIHPKPDPLFLELSNAIKSTEDTGIRDTALNTLRSILGTAGVKLTEPTKKGVVPVLTLLLNSGDKSNRTIAEDCLALIA